MGVSEVHTWTEDKVLGVWRLSANGRYHEIVEVNPYKFAWFVFDNVKGRTIAQGTQPTLVHAQICATWDEVI